MVNGQVTIFIIGDTRSGHDVHQTIVNRIAEEDYDAVLNTGDLVGVGKNRNQWERFLQISEPFIDRQPDSGIYLPVVGNHDIHDEEVPYENWHRYLPWLPGNGEYYYQDFENLRLIVLNSTPRDDVVQRDSLRSWLESNTRDWLIVSWHYPTFPFGSKRVDMESLQEWWPLLYEHEVDIVVNGHAHHYTRSHPLRPLPADTTCAIDPESGIIQIISGGAGAPLYSVGKDEHNRKYFDFALAADNDLQHHYCKITTTETQMTVEAISIDGVVFDQFVLRKD